MNVELTRISGKGQLVIPQEIRKQLKIKKGTRFAVYGQDDTVILKKIQLPTLEDFNQLTRKTSEIARKKGITKKDIDKAIQETK
ncbi:MAG: AbrB family transcriptional regulator [Candidatus Altiarchaeales archaeon ex4484_2]|nr:MAG: AbrB family transcriptional regulator [Candidatus Altiarchaeales archaeon ex4484_2]